METILSVAGVTAILVLFATVLLQYFPKLRIAWGGVKSEVKMLSVLAAYFVVGAIVGFGGCLPELKELFPKLICADTASFIEYAFAVLFAVGAGQGVFGLLPELKDVTYSREIRPA
jgi:hypothetical protein